jgi:hypothetical protein
MKLFLPSLSVLLLVAAPAFASSISITTSSLPNGTVQTPYSATVKTSGGCTPVKWAVASGSLPAGVSMTPSTSTTSAALTGTPSKAATYSFTVSATGCGGHAATKAYTVTVQASANHVVDLSWSQSTSSNISGYNLYRSPDGNSWSKINASLVASTLYDDSSVSNGSTYYYAATAVDTSGHESAKSSSIKVVVP